MRVWRICRAVYAAEAFSGEGARRFGGRWNSRGVLMVYCSSSLALAAIELFVHLEPSQAPPDLVSISATLSDVEPARALEPDELPPYWWTDDALTQTRAIGDEWVRSSASLALRVPSVPIRSEWNLLVNPMHPRIRDVEIDPPQPFVFDARMFRRAER
jgi:RES domain-containing protein